MSSIIRHLLVFVLILPAGVSLADDLGRLFSTPMERARIDDLRAGRKPAGGGTVDAEPAGVDQLVLNGTLTGSNGKRRVWVNGTPVDPDAPGGDLTLLYDGRARLQWRGGQVVRTLKPGQGVDKSTGKVFELYDRAPGKVGTAVSPPATDKAQVD